MRALLLLTVLMLSTGEPAIASLRLCRRVARAIVDTGTVDGISLNSAEKLAELRTLLRKLSTSNRTSDQFLVAEIRLVIRGLEIEAANAPWEIRPETVNALPKEYREIQDIRAGRLLLTRAKFGTRVYHGVQARPRADFPEIDRNASGVVIYFGGAGTRASSGKIFGAEINAIRKFGLSGLSIDYPFHAYGPRADTFFRREVFRDWIIEIIDHYSKADLPIVLLGHSFGPRPILEALSHKHFPNVIGGILGSPAGITPEMFLRYSSNRETTLKEFQKEHDIQVDERADFWDDSIGLQLARSPADWKRITVPLVAVSGDRDPYVDLVQLRRAVQIFPSCTLDVLPGAHHFIFDAADSGLRYTRVQGHVLKFFKDHLRRDLTQLDYSEAELIERLRTRYLFSMHFRRYLEERKVSMTMIERDPKFLGKEIFDSYQARALEDIRAECLRKIAAGKIEGVDRIQPLLARPGHQGDLGLYLKFLEVNQ